MDGLARVASPAADLLDRVDGALLAYGAPADHPIWPLLRRLGVMPGELVARLCGCDPHALRLAAQPLRALAVSYVDGLGEAGWNGPSPRGWGGAAGGGWTGPAADAFAAGWAVLAGHLADGADSMAGRLRLTASYVDDVARWLAATRDAVAVALAECLVSAEAATLRALPRGALAGVPGLADAWFVSGGPLAGGLPSRGGSAAGSSTGGCAAAGSGSGTDRVGVVRAAAAIGAHLLRAAAGALDEGELVRSRWAGRLDEILYRPGSPAPVPPDPTHLTLPG